ncbi:unnamed protein product [Urochloa decumbens]|uniref:BTB domain-containing protein n=1 Tax=Urochloa decumbens TaxID=240449 RepID=A0ABC8VXR4_9POAL
MASTAAALMTSAARRLTRSTASAMVLRDVSGSHKLTIDGCTPSKNLHKGWAWISRSFDVAGHSWRIRYSPHEGDDGNTISLHLELDPRAGKHDDRTGAVKSIEFSVLDQSGNPVPAFTRAVTGPCAFGQRSRSHGFDNFIRWSDLEASGCLKDDRFSVQCDVTVTADLTELGVAYHDDGAAPARLHHEHHLVDLMWKDKRGADVTIDVGGEATFDAHWWLLAERSAVFREDLLPAASKEKKTSAAAHRRIEIQHVEPRVFRAMLHYMYNNTLPEKMEEDRMVLPDKMEDDMAMAQGLLAAADRFKVDGLKPMCEEMIAKRIDVSTAALTLAVAEQHGCKALKAACLEFMTRPENLKAVMETEGYEKAKPIVHPLVVELVMKQWLASAAATKCVN